MNAKPIKWHGGKHYLAKWILDLAPDHVHYVEPFAGGLSVLLVKEPGSSEVVNDLNGSLTNFWRVLHDTESFETMKRMVETTPVSETEWERAFTVLKDDLPEGVIDIRHAWAFFVIARQSRQGLMREFCTLSRNRTRRGMNEQASSWLTAISGLSEVHERLKSVVILNQPAVDVIKKQDSENTWFYLDPPYLHETRVSRNAYDHEMSAPQHTELLTAIGVIKGKFSLSGYDSEMYNMFAQTYGWRKEVYEIANHSSSAKVKEIKRECLWMNY